jgi:preprotein translocase subunit SecE
VAQSRRRNRDVEEPLDEGIEATADTDALDEVTDDVEIDDVDLDEADSDVDEADAEADIDAEEDVDDRKARKAKAKAKKSGTVDLAKTDRDEVGPGIFGRFIRFVREVVAELRKVVRPTRKDLVVYTTVVVAFVTVMLTLVGTLDWAFAKAVLWVFSGN